MVPGARSAVLLSPAADWRGAFLDFLLELAATAAAERSQWKQRRLRSGEKY